MCSIIGVNGAKKLKPENIRLLYGLGDNRGKHACGYTDGFTTYRKAVDYKKFVADVLNEHLEKEGTPNSFIGHTRHATSGDKNDDKLAHPFDFDKVIGVHNGTIYNFNELKKEYKDAKDRAGEKVSDYKVDSKMIYYLIDKIGIKKTLPKLEGKVGLAYWDKISENREDWILNLYRFDRPLCYGWKDGALYYGSLPDYLKSLGIEKPIVLKENTLYQFRGNKLLRKVNIKKGPSKKQEEPEVGKVIPFTGGNSHGTALFEKAFQRTKKIRGGNFYDIMAPIRASSIIDPITKSPVFVWIENYMKPEKIYVEFTDDPHFYLLDWGSAVVRNKFKQEFNELYKHVQSVYELAFKSMRNRTEYYGTKS